MNAALDAWKRRYERQGLATLPLPAGVKAPPLAGMGYLDMPPATQWARAGDGFKGNIGLLAGGGLCVVDCDAGDAERNAAALFAGLGIDAPLVRTPSGGAHIYVMSAPPERFTWCRLAIGAGELRARRAYVVAPPSLVNGKSYAFEHGAPEAVPTVAWCDLQPFIGKALPSDAPLMTAPPVALLRRQMTLKVEQQLSELRERPRYIPFGDGRTRSEVEQSVIAQLVLAGWRLDEIAMVFEQYRCGHYIERKDKNTYLRRSYCRAVTWLAQQSERPEIAALYHDAQSWAWRGRTGEHDKAVFMALLSLAWAAGSFTFYGATRDLAVMTGKSRPSVTAALGRLCDAGLLRRAGHSEDTALWDVLRSNAISHTLGSIGVAVEAAGRQKAECVAAKVNVCDAVQAELWTQLGRTAGAAHARLSIEPVTAAALAVALGHYRSTVGRALRTLASVGLARESERGGWVVGDAPLDDALAAFDCAGRHTRRVEMVENQRRAWAIGKRRTRPTPVGDTALSAAA